MRELASGFRIAHDLGTGEEFLEVPYGGEALNNFPMFNKGTAFTAEERDALGLRGLLPPRVVTMEQQTARVLHNQSQKSTNIERYIHLISLLDRNETLFYRILVDHLEEMLPIIYTPTVGQACQQFGRIYRRARGLYFTPEDVGRIDEVLSHWPYQEVRVVVVTDGQRILGLGDLGASGMGIPIGKLSLYVAGGGIHPAHTLPVCLDVGTDNEALRADPLYLGTPKPRLAGAAYDAFVEAFVQGLLRRWPHVLLQFEDFGIGNAFRLLDRYRDRACSFNDDIQGTAVVALAGLRNAARIAGRRLEECRVFIAGAGSAGIGIARFLAPGQAWVFDSKGLVTSYRSEVRDFQKPFARTEAPGSLLDAARRVRPHVLVGVSGKPGIFTKELLGCMEGARPIVFALSNPTDKAECTPSQAAEWTGGRAIVATGSPFAGTPQCNNMYAFPGIGLGLLASGARRVTDRMLLAASRRLAELAPEGGLYPRLRDIRRVSREIAFAVGREAIAEGLAEEMDDADLRTRIEAEVWEPRYLPYRPARAAR